MSQSVLMVDDSVPIHALVGMHLEPDALKLHSAYDGRSALSMAASIRPNLILLDVNMPHLDGFEVCHRLKADPQTKGAAVMFLTSESASHNRLKGLDLGAVDYITKPIEPEKLRARVRWALRTHLRQERSPLIDGLTGLWNRSYLDEHLAAQASWADRSDNVLACITVDVDPLSRTNERYDDVAGEEIVRAVADIFMDQCRGSEDTVYYCGDRTFAAVLAKTDRAGAERLVERVRQQVEQELKRDDGDPIVRCNFGVADTQAQTNVPLLDRAIAAARKATPFLRTSPFVDPSMK